MQPDEIDHIRADVRTAIVENQHEDRSLLPDLIDHLLTALSRLSHEPYSELKPYIFDPDQDARPPVVAWSDALLRECQIRAVSQIPFGEPADDEPHWSDHL